MFNISRYALAALLIGTLSLSADAKTTAAKPLYKDDPGKRLTVMNADGKPVLTYEYAQELDKNGKVSFDTAKVFYHVVAPDGKETLTKGPGGKLPHHRGIFIGWNRIKHNGKNHDIWHMRNTQQKHLSFSKQLTTDAATTIASKIQWIGTQAKPVLEETRTVTVHHKTPGAYAIIDFQSELTAAHGDLELKGDPEHAGIQFRASQKVAKNNSAKYTLPAKDVNGKDVSKKNRKEKYTNLPWAAQTFEMDGQKWTVQQMAHPGNADKKARWSAYRNYGRFGQYPSFKLANGKKTTVRYRFRITKGQAPDRKALNAAYEKYAK